MHQLLTSRDGLGIPQDEKSIVSQLAEHSVMIEVDTRAVNVDRDVPITMNDLMWYSKFW